MVLKEYEETIDDKVLEEAMIFAEKKGSYQEINQVRNH